MVKATNSGTELDYLQRYLIEEVVEEYQEAQIPRREMVRRVLIMTGSIPATASILLAMGCGAGPAPTATPTRAAAVTATTRAATTTTAAGATGTPRAATGATAGTPTRTAAAAGTPTGAGSPTRTASPAGTPTRAGSPVGTPSGVTVSPTDPAIEVASVEFPGQAGAVRAYKSQPRGLAQAPGLIVVHENRGLTEHFRDMTRRYARDGYIALGVDLVSRRGGTDQVTDPAQLGAYFMQTSRNELVQDLLSGIDYLKTQPNFNGKVGAVGYCFGGGMTWVLATRSPDLAAAVPYYGPPPDPIDDIQNVAAAVLAFYGETDQRINQNIPAIEAAMRQYNKTFQSQIYPGAGHAFNNDTGQAYNAGAARDAYQRSLDWFGRYLLNR